MEDWNIIRRLIQIRNRKSQYLLFSFHCWPKVWILFGKLVDVHDSSSNTGMFKGNLMLLIPCICLSKYMDLACSLDIGSNISLSRRETVDNTGICDAWVTGVDFAIGVSMSVVPGRVFTEVGLYSSSLSLLKLGYYHSLFRYDFISHTKLTIYSTIDSIHRIYRFPISIR